jgi:hypothetical protein
MTDYDGSRRRLVVGRRGVLGIEAGRTIGRYAFPAGRPHLVGRGNDLLVLHDGLTNGALI